jgi:hypothetical protein
MTSKTVITSQADCRFKITIIDDSVLAQLEKMMLAPHARTSNGSITHFVNKSGTVAIITIERLIDVIELSSAKYLKNFQ